MNRNKLVIIFLILVVSIYLQIDCSQAFSDDAYTRKEAELLAKQYIDEFVNVQKYQAGTRLYELYSTRISHDSNPDISSSDNLLIYGNQGIAKHESLNLLNLNITPLFSSFSNLSQQSNRDLDKLIKSWISARTEANISEIEAFDLEQQTQITGQLTSLLNADNKWLWGCALLSAIGLVLAFSYIQRHKLRRLFWVKRSRYLFIIVAGSSLIAITLIPTVVLFLFGNKTYDALIAAQSQTGEQPPRSRLNAEVNELQEIIENEKLKTKYETSKQNLVTQLNDLKNSLEPFVHGENKALLDEWADFKAQTIQLQVEYSIYTKLLKEMDEDRKRSEEMNASLSHLHESLGNTQNKKYIYAAGLGFTIFLGFGAITLTYSRQVAKQINKNKRTCPSCLNVDSLIEEKDNLGVSQLSCTAQLSSMTDEICDFKFNSSYASYPKFSFPTLGIASSGKTHWMAMVYRLLNHSQSPSGVNFERLKSPETQKFDRIVNDLLSERRSVEATRIGDRLPCPLTFLFRDNDRIERSRLLVSLFDYGGRITIDQSLWQRGRALNADGYFFFIDPTKRSDEQVEALNLFREDVRSVMNIPEGRQMDRPVALCLSKLDLMPRQEYAQGGNFINDFYSELQKLDLEYPEMTNSLLEKRSALTESLLPIIFPGWNVVDTVRELFGPRVMIFPMTPVGLQNPGEDDLSKVAIDPYAILEPFMWLLHMNGYPILK